jgi:Peroxidase
MLDISVSGQHKLAPQWLRLSFHDAGTFNKAVPEGGANGCLMNDPNMRLEEENGNLDIAINTLEQIRNNWEQLTTTCIDISSADIIQFAGFFASVRQTGAVPGMTSAKISQLLTFKWGRPDEVNCNIDWCRNLPGFALGTDPGSLPLRCKMSGKEIKTKMMDRNGFTAEEATALIGAHTIGLTRNVFGPFAAPWVANGADDATASGPVFDNTFFDFMANTIVAKTTTAFDINPAPFTSIFPTWVQTSSPTTLNYLDTDLALAFPPASTADHRDYHAHTVAFSQSNAFFLDTFHNALTKMGMLGVTAVLSLPGACTTCQTAADPITVPVVVQLVASLGDAISSADSSIAVQQDAVKDQQAIQTTAVQSFALTENGTNTVEIFPLP